MVQGKGRQVGAESKEEFWRKTLKQWQESKKSQAQFCRDERLNVNTFCFWKKTIQDRDAAAPSSTAVKRSEKESNGGANGRAPSFVRLSVSDGDGATVSTLAAPVDGAAVGGERLAAELVDTVGRRLRIFNGADQMILTAVIAALSTI